MNSKTKTALTTRRNAYHTPVITAVKKAYEDFVNVARINPNDEYYYGRLYHHHKGEPRNSNGGIHH